MLEPVSDVLVLEEEKLKTSGIVIPGTVDGSKDAQTIFKVVAAGPGDVDHGDWIENCCKVGDRIILSTFGRTNFKYEGKYLVFGRGRDVLTKVVEENDANIKEVKGDGTQ